MVIYSYSMNVSIIGETACIAILNRSNDDKFVFAHYHYTTAEEGKKAIEKYRLPIDKDEKNCVFAMKWESQYTAEKRRK